MSSPTNLFQRIPVGRRVSDDELLDLFFSWVDDLGIEPYPAQEEAILEVMTGQHLVLSTPTGSGKSLVATAAHFWCIARNRISFYTAPIKALVNEKFFELCRHFGAENVGMLTGDASINSKAPIICCTAEVLSNMVLRHGETTPVEYVIMDEFHFYGDRDRGSAWQIPLIEQSRATFLLMSATLGDTSTIERHIEELTGRDVSHVTSSERPVPLDFDYSEIPLHETIQSLVSQNRHPIYLVNFSQKLASEQAQNLMSVDITSKEEKRASADAMRDTRFDSPYGKVVQRHLRHGIGLHHAGLLPKYRRVVERLAQAGHLKVVSGTDTLGVGVNIPIRTVLFTRLCKYDGVSTRILSVREFQQIAGRAGRKGFDDQGWVVVQAPEHDIENRLLAAKASVAVGKKRKFVRKKPPARGFVNWTENTSQKLIQGNPERLRPKFNLTHSIMVNVLQRETEDTPAGDGYRALLGLIARSHGTDTEKSSLRKRAKMLFRALLVAEIVTLVPRSPDSPRGRRVMLGPDLQADFSIFHTLSLYLVEVLKALDPAHEEYAIDVLTMVESILEHPGAILLRQVSKLKGERVAELKAQGVEYEERMAELDKITYPKPREEFIYDTFNRFSSHHPWVGHENIRPKSIARDMFERCTSFREYVVEYGLERMEGTLLRYLSQCYRTLVQSVPEPNRTPEVYDIMGYLRAVLERADSSLLREWETLQGIEPSAGPEESPAPEPFDISRDSRAFHSRIRAELHQIVRALSNRELSEVEELIRPGGDEPWTEASLGEALEPFFEEYGDVAFDHRARLSDRTTILETGPHQWEVTQVLMDTADESLWRLEGRIDLREDTAPPGPLIMLDRIGE